MKMSYQARTIVTPGASRKRKEREPFYSFKPPPAPNMVKPLVAGAFKREEPPASNQLLAGYLAHEFLTRGTLFGEKFDPARAEAVPLAAAGGSSAEHWRRGSNSKAAEEAAQQPVAMKKKQQQYNKIGYAEVASMLKTEEAHIPGVVNPTQLAHWIQKY